jgi:hypothetical protein
MTARPWMFGRAIVVRPSPPYVVPIREKSAVFCEMGSSWPSHVAQPRGAKFPANILTSAMNGSDMTWPPDVPGWETIGFPLVRRVTRVSGHEV